MSSKSLSNLVCRIINGACIALIEVDLLTSLYYDNHMEPIIFRQRVMSFAERLLDSRDVGVIEASLTSIDDDEISKLISQKDPTRYFKEVNDRLSELIFCLYKCGETLERYRKAGISDKIFYDTFNDIRLWADYYRAEHGLTGMAEFGWISLLINMGVFNVEGLEYQPTELSENNRFGLPAGQKMILLHIPRGTSLSRTAVLHSLRAGEQFVSEFFDEYAGSPIGCESWLMWPGLKQVLSRDSNILAFQNMFDIVSCNEADTLVKFVFGRSDVNADLEGYEPTTGLQKNLLAYRARGKRFGVGYGILKREYAASCDYRVNT